MITFYDCEYLYISLFVLSVRHGSRLLTPKREILGKHIIIPWFWPIFTSYCQISLFVLVLLLSSCLAPFSTPDARGAVYRPDRLFRDKMTMITMFRGQESTQVQLFSILSCLLRKLWMFHFCLLKWDSIGKIAFCTQWRHHQYS